MKNNKSIVIQWGRAIAGRESMGLELFLSVSQYYEGLVTDDKLGNVQAHIFENGNFDTLTGMMILTGDDKQIRTILDSDKHQENVTKAMHVVGNVRCVTGDTGEAIPQKLQNLSKWRKELGL